MLIMKQNMKSQKMMMNNKIQYYKIDFICFITKERCAAAATEGDETYKKKESALSALFN